MAESTVKKLNVLKALQEIRVGLIDLDIKKSGRNDYSKFDYFELSDFLPLIQKLALEKNVSCIYEIGAESAKLHICDINDIENRITFAIPVAEVNIKGANGIQAIGGLTTYTRRYLYMIAFEIAENDEFDKEVGKPGKKSNNAPNEENDVNNQLVTQNDVNTLDAVVVKKGVTPESILERYKVGTFNEMSFQQFNAAMKILSKMPDKS